MDTRPACRKWTVNRTENRTTKWTESWTREGSTHARFEQGERTSHTEQRSLVPALCVVAHHHDVSCRHHRRIVQTNLCRGGKNASPSLRLELE